MVVIGVDLEWGLRHLPLPHLHPAQQRTENRSFGAMVLKLLVFK